MRVAALHDQDLVGVSLARQALIRKVLEEVGALFASDGAAVLDHALLDRAVLLNVSGVLYQEITNEHEVLGDAPTRLGRHGGWEGVCFESLVEIVLPQ